MEGVGEVQNCNTLLDDKGKHAAWRAYDRTRCAADRAQEESETMVVEGGGWGWSIALVLFLGV